MKFTHDRSLLYSRGDRDDPRLGDIAQMVSLQDFEKRFWDWAIIGFPDDRGVTLNGGRPGAAEGPAAIRKWLYRLVAPKPIGIADLGDLTMSDDLHADHERAAQAIAIALGHASRVAVLGGGHDWGFSPISALMQGGSAGFINFDAHLDVRPSKVHHSGTSYWRALEAGVNGEFAKWIGVQRSATSAVHAAYVAAKKGTICWARESTGGPVALSGEKDGADYYDISLDMDVFPIAEAPGVSAPQPLGWEAQTLLPVIKNVLSISKVRTFGIYEAAPLLDSNGDPTTRLAARCLWEALSLP
ncbi:MAG: formimidoylglutamase [Armatimonadota bacterium]|nr:formimidoylglutamase [Armatimonadota bacterium]